MRFFLPVLIALFTNSIFAAEIKTVSGKKVTVEISGESFKTGDILKVTNPSGKTVGVVKVTKISGNTAEGIFKGKVQKGYKVSLRPPKEKKPMKAKSAAPVQDDDDDVAAFNTKIGAMFGYNMADMDATLPNSGTTVSLSGSGMSLKGLADITLKTFEILSLRAMVGMEQLNVDGATNTECGGACEVKIMYLSGDFWARYLISTGGAMTPWVGLGFSLLFPLSKDASAISESSITNSNLFSVGGGIDWQLASGSYIPLQFEYNLYPSTDSVKTSAMTFRAGYGMSF